jgi:Icc protein
VVVAPDDQPPGPAVGRSAALSDADATALPPPELHTVTDDEVVVYRGGRAERIVGLASDTEYEVAGVAVRTLPRPAGEHVATVATVNDVHFGEVECGRLEGHDIGPVLRCEPGEAPYPEVMNAAAAEEIAEVRPDLVVAKGDLTAAGRAEEHAAFEACYGKRFGDRLIATRGNHDNPAGGGTFAPPPVQARNVAGVTVVVLDTSRPGQGGGSLDADQLDELDTLAAAADRPVLVFGHHPVRDDTVEDWMGDASALDAGSSAGLLAVVARRRRIVGYFAGHTHRNRVRRFPVTGEVPFAEVAATKDFPGSWAEYRIFEGGALAVHHRISDPAALSWSERCRALVFGLYPRYALGQVQDRCFPIGW